MRPEEEAFKHTAMTSRRTPPPAQRADAARNREAILTAAAGLFAEHGADSVTMDQVAAAAGVGKGTVFRRFGDRSGLAAALLADHEQELQDAVLYGPPPLGPGAAPSARLAAFVATYLDHVISHLDLARASDAAPAGARYRSKSYRFWHQHVATLLVGTADPEAAAHALLAGLSAEHIAGVLPELGENRLRDGLTWLATAQRTL